MHTGLKREIAIKATLHFSLSPSIFFFIVSGAQCEAFPLRERIGTSSIEGVMGQYVM